MFVVVMPLESHAAMRLSTPALNGYLRFAPGPIGRPAEPDVVGATAVRSGRVVAQRAPSARRDRACPAFLARPVGRASEVRNALAHLCLSSATPREFGPRLFLQERGTRWWGYCSQSWTSLDTPSARQVHSCSAFLAGPRTTLRWGFGTQAAAQSFTCPGTERASPTAVAGHLDIC